MMQTTDSEFRGQDASYVQYSTDLAMTRNRGIHAEPVATPHQIEIVIDWEIVRREAQNVTNTQFFRDLMTSIVARKRHCASPPVAISA